MARRTPKPAAPKPEPFKFASAGRYTQIGADGKVENNTAMLTKLAAARMVAKQNKTASLFGDGELGPANIADSNNIGYYSYQFPVDALEMPASRAEELEFFRLAYTRDPIVTRGIDLHTEILSSKMKLEKPKCSVETFADMVFDYYQRLANDTRLFSVVTQGIREYHIIGEVFFFVEQPDNFDDIEIPKVTREALKKGRGFQAGIVPLTEANNEGGGDGQKNILPDFVQARRRKSSSKVAAMTEDLEYKFAELGEVYRNEDPKQVHRRIIDHKIRLAKLAAYKPAISKTAAPGDAPPPAPADAPPPDAPPTAEGDAPPVDGVDGGGDAAPMDDGGMGGGGMGGEMPSSGGGGGGFGGGDSIPADMADDAANAIKTVETAARDREVNELRRYIHLLERKKSLLEQVKDLMETQKAEEEIFSHVVNPNFDGFDQIQILQPERVEIKNEPGSDVKITYKPSEQEKQAFLEDKQLNPGLKDELEQTGFIPLNDNPILSSYVIHFARKKSGYEAHGRSVLQTCMRSIIYREKLRQVQTTLASRNMTPKVLITAPGVSDIQVAQLRAHADEAISDPDYVIVTNYEVNWNQIDSAGRLLQLNDEWQHTNSNLAIGLGFSPEILIGEGMYGGNRIQLQLMETTYVQLREELSDILENQIFKPIAMLKGFYEEDNYGRPRWIYPKVSFAATSLKDNADVYEQFFNLYARGALPAATIYDMLGLDAESIRRQLEDDMFTVSDSRFGELMSNIYSAISGEFTSRTDIVKKVSKNLGLEDLPEEQNQIEGTGEGL